uniref:NADH-ubiquinone oxidoreductase chain 2 n=1 Tax=Cyriopagopus schmidti TaxID=29017 RepID=Q6JT19_CYRSC|nr:NADH dehydrogenase subunit 2 [Cyriopagopus schmidti]AAP51159.1 NADH dehydrogenase subunit 2 [Cyriopagopus schmidti]
MFVFAIVYLISFIVVFSFDEWFLVWVGMEMNMFSFISMVFSKDSWSSLESLFKYFFIQGLSSGTFLVMMYMGLGLEYPLMMKMAAGPFFFWFPSVMMGIGWMECFLLMTFQKLIPLFLMSGMVSVLFMFWGVVGMMIGVAGSYGQQMVSCLMAYSSVNHIGWMMTCFVMKENLWMFYYVLYMLVVGMLILYLYDSKIENLSGMKWIDMMIFFVLVMSMGGIPPMLGFVMKWVVLESMIEVSVVISFIMVFSSLVMIYIYMRMIYEEMMDGGIWMSWESMNLYKLGGLSWMSLIGTFFVPFIVWSFM